MLISPPFLAGESDESQLLEKGLKPVRHITLGTSAPEGNFPVSRAFKWHTGLHLESPDRPEPHAAKDSYRFVRAIADGKIIVLNKPRVQNQDEEDGQTYNSFGDHKLTWTDNGMIILEHETEIGAQGKEAVKVKFYSSYMHLSKIEAHLKLHHQVYRKDILGDPGQIYGHRGQIEFNICCDTENLERLIGRCAQWEDPKALPTKDGRTDVVFGDLYIFLPAHTPICCDLPTHH